jgi:hypothetical protein
MANLNSPYITNAPRYRDDYARLNYNPFINTDLRQQYLNKNKEPKFTNYLSGNLFPNFKTGGTTGDPNQPYHPITNPNGYKQNISPLTVIANAQKLLVSKPYQPSQIVNNAKAILSGTDASTGFSNNPYISGTNYLARISNATGDAYTAARYAMDGQWGNAGVDAGEALLDLIPFRKGKRVVNLSKTNNLPGFYNKMSKLDKSLNNALKVGKAGASADDFIHSSLGKFLFGDPNSNMQYGPGGQTTDGCPPNYFKNAQGKCVPEFKPNFKMPTNYSTDRQQVVVPMQENLEIQNKLAQQKAEARRQFIGPAHFQTDDEKKINLQKKKNYVTTHPNTKLDSNNNIVTINPDRDMEGRALPHTPAAKIDRGMNTLATGLEAAGYVEGLGLLGKLGKGALTKSIESRLLSNPTLPTLKLPEVVSTVDDVPESLMIKARGLFAKEPMLGKQHFWTDAELENIIKNKKLQNELFKEYEKLGPTQSPKDLNEIYPWMKEKWDKLIKNAPKFTDKFFNPAQEQYIRNTIPWYEHGLDARNMLSKKELTDFVKGISKKPLSKEEADFLKALNIDINDPFFQGYIKEGVGNLKEFSPIERPNSLFGFGVGRMNKNGGVVKYGPGGATIDGCPAGYNKHPLTGECIPNGWVAPQKAPQAGPTVEGAKQLTLNTISNASKNNRIQSVPQQATLDVSRSNEPWRQKQAAEIRRKQAQENSALAQTMGSFTPSGSNSAAGAIGAETFTNMNPLITGPIMSTSRLYGAGRSMVDPNTYNPYFGSNKGVMGNILGGLNLAGDIGMLRTTLRNPTGSFNPEPNPANRIEWSDFTERNARVKQAWADAQKRKAGIPATSSDYAAYLENLEKEKQAGDIIRNQKLFEPDPLSKIDISEIVNKRGLVTPGYKSTLNVGPYWEKNKNQILKFIEDENAFTNEQARANFIKDAQSFKKNVLDVNNVSEEAPSALYRNIHQLIKENNIRDAFPSNTSTDVGNSMANQILGFIKNNMSLTDAEAADLLHGYNPSNPFTKWSDARVGNAINLLNRQRLASGLMWPTADPMTNIGGNKLPLFGRYSYAEKNPIQNLTKTALHDLKNTDKSLINNAPDWFDRTIAEGKWKDVGMEMRGSMQRMGLDHTNEQDVLEFLKRFKAEQNAQALQNYSEKPNVEDLFGGINKNKYGGSIKEYGGPLVDFYKGKMTGPNIFANGGPGPGDGKTLPPIYTDDPRKVQAYNDSLALYNFTNQNRVDNLLRQGFAYDTDKSRKVNYKLTDTDKKEYQKAEGVNPKKGLQKIIQSGNDGRIDNQLGGKRDVKAQYELMHGKIAPTEIAPLYDSWWRHNPYLYNSKNMVFGGDERFDKDEPGFRKNPNYNKPNAKDKEGTVIRNFFEVPIYKKPVQPYILQQEPTLERKVSKMEPIRLSHTPSLSIRMPNIPNIQIPNIKTGKYRVSYWDPEIKDWNERSFMSQQESDQFANEMSQRGYPGSYGNVTQRIQYANGGAVNLNSIIKQNRQDRDNNYYSGGISKYEQGGQANRFFYNKGYGVPRFDDGGQGPCPAGMYWDTVSKKCVPRPAPFVTSDIDEYNRRAQLATDSTNAAISSRADITQNNANSAAENTVTETNASPSLGTSDKSWKDKKPIAKKVTKFKKNPPARYTTEEYRKKLVEEGNVPKAVDEFVDSSASVISGDQVINPVAITDYPVDSKHYDEKGNLIDTASVQYTPEFQEAKQNVKYNPAFSITYIDTEGKQQTTYVKDYDTWKKIHDRLVGSRAFKSADEKGDKSQASLLLGQLSNHPMHIGSSDEELRADPSHGHYTVSVLRPNGKEEFYDFRTKEEQEEYLSKLDKEPFDAEGARVIVKTNGVVDDNLLFDSKPTERFEKALTMDEFVDPADWQNEQNDRWSKYYIEPTKKWGGPTRMNQFGYLVDRKANGGSPYPINLNLPKYEQPKGFFTGYTYGNSPEPNVNIYGVGAYGEKRVSPRMTISGDISSQSVTYPGGSQMFNKPIYNVGMKYRFKEGGGPGPGPFQNYLNLMNQDYKNWYSVDRGKDDGFDSYYYDRLQKKSPMVTTTGPAWQLTKVKDPSQVWYTLGEDLSSDDKRRIDQGKITGKFIKDYSTTKRDSSMDQYNSDLTKYLMHKNTPKQKNGGDISIPNLPDIKGPLLQFYYAKTGGELVGRSRKKA